MQGGCLVVAIVACYWARTERKERVMYCNKLLDIAPEVIKGNMSQAAALLKLEESVDKLADAINRRPA
jgi:hydroxyethylthiazole kinase-like sugar kinase family protein